MVYDLPIFQTIPQNHAYPDQNGMITYPGPAGFIDAYGANFTPRWYYMFFRKNDILILECHFNHLNSNNSGRLTII